MPNDTRQPSQLTVLFLSGEQHEADGSRIYRCVYQAKQIEQAGGRAQVRFVGDRISPLIAQADVVVLSRCPWTESSTQVVREAQEKGKLLLGDLDDRIFCPWDVDETGFIRTKSMFKRDADALTRTQNRQRDVLRLLPAFHQTITSTSALAEELGSLGLQSFVSRNAIDAEARALIDRPRTRLKKVLFMTGTRTHDADFRISHGAIHRFLTGHSDVEFTMLGPIAPPQDLVSLPNVRIVDKLPLSELHGFVAEFDVCLVPLEGTTFNDCKSALKFIECGAVSVPVIASPRREFIDAISDGTNGLLAPTPEAFWNALERLYASPELLARIARGAYESVRTRHTIRARGGELAQYFCRLLDEGGARRKRPRPISGVAGESKG